MNKKLWSIFPMALIMAGCGQQLDTSSSSSTTDDLAITASNAQDIAAASSDSASTMNSTASDTKSYIQSANSVADSSYRSYKNQIHLLKYIQDAISLQGGAQKAQLMAASNTSCPNGGSASVDNAASAITVTYTDCKASGNNATITINGTMKITGVDSTENASNFDVSVTADLKVNIAATGTGNAGLDYNLAGDMNVKYTTDSSSATTFTVSGSSFKQDITFKSKSFNSELTDFTITSSYDGSSNYTASIAFTFYSSQLGGKIAVTTPTTLTTDSNGELINDGAIKITGKDNSSLLLDFTGNNQVTVSIDEDGNGDYETVKGPYSWATYSDYNPA